MDEIQNLGDKISKQISDFATQTQTQVDEKLQFTKAEVDKTVKEALAAKDLEFNEKMTALEAKVLTAAPAVIQTQSSNVLKDNDQRIREQLKKFVSSNNPDKDGGRLEIKLYESEDHAEQCDLLFMQKDLARGLPPSGNTVSMKEKLQFASTLTGGGDGRGGRTDYAPFQVSKFFGNPLANMSKVYNTGGSSWQWRFKYGLSGYQWGEVVDQTNTRGTTTTVAWQLPLKDFNVRFDIRTIFLDDTNWMGGDFEGALTRSISYDQEAGAFEAQAMHVNNDQSGTGATVLTGGADGPRSLCGSYGISGSPAFTSGAFVPAAWAPGATVSTNNGLHSLATVDQITTNAAGATSNIVFQDVFNMMAQLPQQYWNGAMKDNLVFYTHPLQAMSLRGLRDNNQTPIFDRVTPGIYPGYIGDLFGIPVIQSRYMHQPVSQTVTAGTTSLFPLYLMNAMEFTSIVRSLTFNVKRFTETNPGSVTFFADTRAQFSVNDIFSGIRLRSTGTASAVTTSALNPGQ